MLPCFDHRHCFDCVTCPAGFEASFRHHHCHPRRLQLEGAAGLYHETPPDGDDWRPGPFHRHGEMLLLLPCTENKFITLQSRTSADIMVANLNRSTTVSVLAAVANISDSKEEKLLFYFLIHYFFSLK